MAPQAAKIVSCFFLISSFFATIVSSGNKGQCRELIHKGCSINVTTIHKTHRVKSKASNGKIQCCHWQETTPCQLQTVTAFRVTSCVIHMHSKWWQFSHKKSRHTSSTCYENVKIDLSTPERKRKTANCQATHCWRISIKPDQSP